MASNELYVEYIAEEEGDMECGEFTVFVASDGTILDAIHSSDGDYRPEQFNAIFEAVGVIFTDVNPISNREDFIRAVAKKAGFIV